MNGWDFNPGFKKVQRADKVNRCISCLYILLQLYERVGISIRGVKRFKGLTRSTDAFHAYEKVEKKFWFCDLFVFIYSS